MSIRHRLSATLSTGFFVLLFGSSPASGASLLHRNVVDLVSLAEIILMGEVQRVSDGLDDGVPYTEITIAVSETIRGDAEGTYTFRQFGLLEPRMVGNGLVNLNVSPPGLPRFKEGERVILFLYKAAAITGLRTTVGGFQGKFHVQDGRVLNATKNLGLFRNVSASSTLLTGEEKRLLTHSKGPVKESAFLSLIRRAVQERWIEEGRLRHED